MIHSALALNPPFSLSGIIPEHVVSPRAEQNQDEPVSHTRPKVSETHQSIGASTPILPTACLSTGRLWIFGTGPRIVHLLHKN